MSSNYMTANPSKFHAIILTKNPKDMVKTTLSIEGHLIKNEAEVNLLGIQIDQHRQRLSFSSHISNICKKAAKQLNAL